MLWEISVLNKIYKNNSFSRIKSRVHEGKRIYAISNTNKFSSVLIELETGDQINCSSNELLLRKYGLESEIKTLKLKTHDYMQPLYLYDCIMELARPLDKQVRLHEILVYKVDEKLAKEWIKRVFQSLHEQY